MLRGFHPEAVLATSEYGFLVSSLLHSNTLASLEGMCMC